MIKIPRRTHIKRLGGACQGIGVRGDGSDVHPSLRDELHRAGVDVAHPARELDGQLVGLHVGHARRAQPQVMVQAHAVFRGQLAGQVVDQQFSQFAARHHGVASSK